MAAATFLRKALAALSSLRPGRKQRLTTRHLRLECLEARTVPTVTAVPETFTTLPNTPTDLNVLSPATAASGEPTNLVSVGVVSPSGPKLTQNADGSLTFGSASTGKYAFNYTIDPVAQEVSSNNGGAGDAFGYSVAISGNIAVVGAYDKQVGSNSFQGAAFVYTLNGGSTWTLQQELTAADGAATDAFGNSVAISGNTIVVGAINHKVGSNPGQGAAYVFTRSGPVWVQQQELTASDGAINDLFGTSVAISGTTVVVGAEGHKVGSNSAEGAAYVYTLTGSTWTQQQELAGANGASLDNFGGSISLSGGTLVVGADSLQVGSNLGQGAAYVYAFSGGTWSQQQELTAADGAANDNFGVSVGVNGNTIVVGADGHEVGTNGGQGAAYVYTLSGSTWTQQQELTSGDGAAGDAFGTSVALSGTNIVVGANDHEVGNRGGQGAAYVFTLSGPNWAQRQELTAADGAVGDGFGVAVAVSGTSVIVGADNHEVGSNIEQGAAYLQDLTESTSSVTVLVTTPSEITATSGGGQSTGVSTAFANPLVVTVTDANGNPITNLPVTVTFTGPSSGAGVVFSGASTVTTNSAGQASIGVSANAITGSYTVTASAARITETASFSLTNTAMLPPPVPPVPPLPVINTISPQAVADGTSLSLTATVQNSAALPVTYSLGAGAPTGASINSQTGQFSWTPSETNDIAPGVYTVTIEATATNAQELVGSTTFSITVEPTSTIQGSGIAARTTAALGLTQSAEYYTNFITAAYNKYLGRAPDAAGLAYWLNLMQNQGLSDEHLEAGFIGSTEYINDHGGAGAGWITGMYVNLLGRTPAQSEVQYWLNQLAGGENTADIAFGFAASQERESERVAADYQQYLGRSASQTEINYWVNVFENGGSNEAVVAGFVSSQEFFQDHGNNIVDWLFASYRATLNRNPDANGLQYWESQVQ